jgi:membrane-bound lytic murein transglycosylase D
MVRRSTAERLAFAALIPLVASCGSRIHNPQTTPQRPVETIQTVAQSTPPSPTVAPEDPVLTLIAESNRHFLNGQAELTAGHFSSARQEFDKAIDLLLESAYGGRTEPRIREHFDRLVDRISAYEVRALAEGDGFTEKKYEPASIDELLAMSATLVPPLEATEALHNAVKLDLQAGEHDIPIPLNRRVLDFIALFQGRLHEFLEEGMRRGSKYLPMIQSVFRAEGLPLDLSYVPLVESAFKPNALSRTKAKGVWQFMRGTGLENGLQQDWYIDERSDPEKATLAAAKYLGTLAKLFDGDWHLALASYNGGPGRLQRALKMARLSDFWKLAEKPRLLPRETRDYVPMILAAIVIARNPVQYGFTFDSEPPDSYETVALAKPVDLRLVAEWANTTIDEIQTLNPELRRWTTPIRDSYTLKVPVGTAEAISAKLEDTSTADLASLKWHIVKNGETLTTIARKLRVSRTDLAQANYLNVNSRVFSGQKLMVPHEATVLMAAQASRPVPVAESRQVETNTVALQAGSDSASSSSAPISVAVSTSSVPSASGAPSEPTKLIYRVKQGDTLISIARLFRTTVLSLQTWNNLSGARIRVGERLTIYAARAN